MRASAAAMPSRARRRRRGRLERVAGRPDGSATPNEVASMGAELWPPAVVRRCWQRRTFLWPLERRLGGCGAPIAAPRRARCARRVETAYNVRNLRGVHLPSQQRARRPGEAAQDRPSTRAWRCNSQRAPRAARRRKVAASGRPRGSSLLHTEFKQRRARSDPPRNVTANGRIESKIEAPAMRNES